MARYRTYKNGITGHKYNGFYIVKGEGKGDFSILNEDKTVFEDKISDFEECEWIIDKETCGDENINIIKQLYGMEIYELSRLFVELMQKKAEQGLTPKSENLYKWCGKVRSRKAKNLSM